MELASLHETPTCEYDAYRKIIDYANMVLAAYDPATACGDAVDAAMEYARERELPVSMLSEVK